MKIEISKKKLIANIHDQYQYVIEIENKKLKTSIKSWISSEKRFLEKAWRKSFIEMKLDFLKKQKNDFEKYFFQVDE